MHTLLIDFNNIAVSKLFSQNVMEKDGYDVHNINYVVWEQEVFSAIYRYFLKYSNTNEIVIAIDSSISWRKVYFKRYKEHRAKTKEKFNIDWNEFNARLSSFVQDLKAHFPFKVLWIKYCEGDDIIGTIVLNNRNHTYTIISSDQDYLQLCGDSVKLFSIKKQTEMSHPNPEMFLQEASLIGQPKDNIFSVITPLDYPSELRKPPFGKKKAEKFLIDGLDKSLNQDIEYKRKFVDENGESQYYNTTINLKERYDINRTLMDFSKIPEKIQKRIMKLYFEYSYPHPSKILEFFNKKGWPWYLENITNVENRLFELYKSEGVSNDSFQWRR